MHTTTNQKTNIVRPKFKKLRSKPKPKPKPKPQPKPQPKVKVKAKAKAKAKVKPTKPAPKSTATGKRPREPKDPPEFVKASSVERVGIATLNKFNSLFGFDVKHGK